MNECKARAVRANALLLGVLLLVAFFFAWLGLNQERVRSTDWREPAAFLLALLFGSSIGASELVARYRDRPVAAIRSSPAAIYILVNGVASLAAFWLLYSGRLAITFAVFGTEHKALNALVVGGFGAMALFRTAIFNVRVGDTTIAVGPAAMLQVILRAADRETDRLRAGPRAARVGEIMHDVVYARARDTLPLHCFALMQNLTLEEQTGLEQALAVLDKKDNMGDQAKAYSLGLLLMNLVGEDVLRRAIEGLNERIKGPPPDRPPVLSRAKDLDIHDLSALLECCRALSAPAPAATNPGAGLAAQEETLIKPPTAVTNPSDQVVIALMRLRQRFGPETVAEAITSIIEARSRPTLTRPTADDFRSAGDGQAEPEPQVHEADAAPQGDNPGDTAGKVPPIPPERST